MFVGCGTLARACRLLIAALGLGLFAGEVAGAQPPRVVDVQVTGEIEPFSRQEIHDLLRSRPNRRFLGIPGVTPSLWIYQLGSPGSAFGRALQRAGEPPALFDAALLEDDRQRLRALYQQSGFLSAAVSAFTEEIAPDRVRVRFEVVPGPASQIRAVSFLGLEELSAAEREALLAGSVLRLQRAYDHDGATPRVLAHPDQRLAEGELLDERRRLLASLRDIGFARVTRDSIRAFAQPVDTLAGQRPVFDVRLEIATGERYRFGDVRFRVTGPETALPRIDTFEVGDGNVVTSIVDERRLEPALLLRSLRFAPGELYNQSALLDTRRRLDGTGAFAFSEVVPLAAEAGGAHATDTLPALPHRIVLRTRPRHAVRLEGFVLQRTGVLGAEGTTIGGEELGVGVGASYRNANALGAGEQFVMGLNASVAGDLVEFPTAQVEGSVSLAMPYLLWPFGALEPRLEPYDVRTRVSMGFLAARRDELRLLIRGRATANLRFEVYHSPSLASFVDVLDFQLSDPDTLSGFSAQFLDLIEDPVARQFVLEDYTSPQVNNAVRYTLRSMTADPFRRDRGHAVEGSVELGGNLPYLLDRFVFSPGEVEGSLPGVPLFGGGGRLEYRPYTRATIDARRYVAVDPHTVLALKGMVGVAHPTGHAPVVPFDRRFYIGGVGSVRGWDLRQLGPGRVPPEASAFVQGGDIKLESGVELRRVLLRQFIAADWQLALFADAGNVWFGPRNPGDPDGRFRFTTFPAEIAVGAGTGVRVAWEFLILRLDLAWQVRSPVPDEPLFPEGNRPRLHFGLGQAF